MGDLGSARLVQANLRGTPSTIPASPARVSCFINWTYNTRVVTQGQQLDLNLQDVPQHTECRRTCLCQNAAHMHAVAQPMDHIQRQRQWQPQCQRLPILVNSPQYNHTTRWTRLHHKSCTRTGHTACINIQTRQPTGQDKQMGHEKRLSPGAETVPTLSCLYPNPQLPNPLPAVPAATTLCKHIRSATATTASRQPSNKLTQYLSVLMGVDTAVQPALQACTLPPCTLLAQQISQALAAWPTVTHTICKTYNHLLTRTAVCPAPRRNLPEKLATDCHCGPPMCDAWRGCSQPSSRTRTCPPRLPRQPAGAPPAAMTSQHPCSPCGCGDSHCKAAAAAWLLPPSYQSPAV